MRLPRAVSLVLTALLAACTQQPTGALVVLNTNTPASREMSVRASVRLSGSAADASTVPIVHGGSSPAAIAFPASFGVVPASGQAANESVDVVFDVEIAGASAGDPPITFERTVHFAFVPQQTVLVPVFLNAACGAPAEGCQSASPCTMASLCAEAGLTCGDDGHCVDPSITAQPLGGDADPLQSVDLDVPEYDFGAQDAVANDGTVTDSTDAADVIDADAGLDATDATDAADTTDSMDATDVLDAIDAFDASDAVSADGIDATDVPTVETIPPITAVSVTAIMDPTAMSHPPSGTEVSLDDPDLVALTPETVRKSAATMHCTIGAWVGRASGGAYSGIYVYYVVPAMTDSSGRVVCADTGLIPPTLVIGERVTRAIGQYTEFCTSQGDAGGTVCPPGTTVAEIGLTSFSADPTSAISPTITPISSVPTINGTFGMSRSGDETYEGAVIQISNVSVATAPNSFQEFTVQDPMAESITVTAQLFPAVQCLSSEFVVGHSFGTLTGVLWYDFGTWRVTLRVPADVDGQSCPVTDGGTDAGDVSGQ